MYSATLAIDNILDTTSVPLATEMTRVNSSKQPSSNCKPDANPDPFTLTIAYYGYDHYNGVTTYLGYFIVSINQTTSQGTKKYASDANNYWELFVNGNPSTDGMDSVLVEPGDQVEFKWVPRRARC
jgi:hypothetical protein